MRGRQPRHGHAVRGKKSHIYLVWAAMLTRCNNSNSAFYPDYGGRGIRVCDRWKVFDNFIADMGEPEIGMTLDRIDNNGP